MLCCFDKEMLPRIKEIFVLDNRMKKGSRCFPQNILLHPIKERISANCLPFRSNQNHFTPCTLKAMELKTNCSSSTIAPMKRKGRKPIQLPSETTSRKLGNFLRLSGENLSVAKISKLT